MILYSKITIKYTKINRIYMFIYFKIKIKYNI